MNKNDAKIKAQEETDLVAMQPTADTDKKLTTEKRNQAFWLFEDDK